MPDPTPFQTVGPYLHIGLRLGLETMRSPEGGPPTVIRGRLLDGAGAGISDGVLEFWSPGYDVVGRAMTDERGAFALRTVKPPARREAGGTSAPHFAVRVLARGILTELLTRVYFADEPSTAADPILSMIPRARRGTLIATPISTSEYAFDVVVQGENETVFFLV
jgi:protocatechuate 3,4-dioxygenase alpha subunit